MITKAEIFRFNGVRFLLKIHIEIKLSSKMHCFIILVGFPVKFICSVVFI